MSSVGVDGCKKGWIAVYRGRGRLEYGVFPTIRELATYFSDAEQIYVDIPIGLPWKDCPRRPPDGLARQMLGSLRQSSVFSAPCREAAHANDVQSARLLNLQEVGRSLSAQAWGITAKIAEVDHFVRQGKSALREIHPEVCFWALAGKQPMKYRKSKPEGVRERVDVLTRFESETASFLRRVTEETLRKDVQPDDVLDALVAFVKADARVGQQGRLVDQPAFDHLGIPMGMVYLQP